jgi:hypothetical protein
MKIITLIIALSLVTSSALAGPFGYRPSFRPPTPTYRPSTPRPSYAPKPSVAKPNVSTAKQTPAAKPAVPFSEPVSPQVKPAAAPKSGRGTALGPVKTQSEVRPNPTGYSGLTWAGNGFTPMPGNGFSHYPHLWFLWSQTPRAPLIYAPHQAAAPTSSQAPVIKPRRAPSTPKPNRSSRQKRKAPAMPGKKTPSSVPKTGEILPETVCRCGSLA